MPRLLVDVLIMIVTACISAAVTAGAYGARISALEMRVSDLQLEYRTTSGKTTEDVSLIKMDVVSIKQQLKDALPTAQDLSDRDERIQQLVAENAMLRKEASALRVHSLASDADAKAERSKREAEAGRK